MTATKVILKLGRVYMEGHEDNELSYEGETIVFEQPQNSQKRKLIQNFLDPSKKWNCSLFVTDETRELIRSILRDLYFHVNFSIMECFTRSKEEEKLNDKKLWYVSISIKGQLETIKEYQHPVAKDPSWIAMFGEETDDNIYFTSEYAELDEAKAILNQFEPEFTFEYIEPQK